MDRRESSPRIVDGYPSGPAATNRATASALAKIADAVALVLVEGVSDQIAVETAAARRGRDLEAERVVVVPIGGAHAIAAFMTRLGPLGTQVRLAGLCDLREAEVFRRGLAAAQLAAPPALFVCFDDLEDELIRAVGTRAVEAIFEAQGVLASFRSMQNQPAWRGREVDTQMRRFLAAGSRRKLRFAQLLVEAAVDRESLPVPLEGLLAAV